MTMISLFSASGASRSWRSVERVEDALFFVVGGYENRERLAIAVPIRTRVGRYVAGVIRHPCILGFRSAQGVGSPPTPQH